MNANVKHIATSEPPPKSGEAPPTAGQSVSVEESSPAPGSELAVTELASESPVRTALAVVSAQVDAIQAMDLRVGELEARYAGVIFQVETTAGLSDAKKAREEIRESRYALQNMLRGGKVPLNNLKRHMEETTTARIDRLLGVETPIDSQIKGEEQRKADEKRERELAEQRRKDSIEARIEEIRNRASEAVGKPSADIAALIEQTTAIAVDDTFAEFKSKAESVQKMALDKLRYFHQNALTAEQRARELAEQERQLAAERERIAEESRKAEIERVKRETAMQEIQAISHQLLIADTGRAPYCKGGDLESYDWVIKQTEDWPVTEDRFGILVGTAEKVKADTLAKLRERRTDLERRLAEDAQDRRQREEKERAAAIERERLAEQQQRLDAQKAEQEASDRRRREEHEAEERRLANQRAALERQEQEAEAASKLRDKRISGINLIRGIVGMSESLTTLTELDEVIADTAALATEADVYGDLTDEATAARDSTLGILRARRQILADKLERVAEAVRETIVAPTDPVEATDGELLSSTALFGDVASAELPPEPDAPSVDDAIITTLDALATEYNLDDVRGKELIVRMGGRIRELTPAVPA